MSSGLFPSGKEADPGKLWEESAVVGVSSLCDSEGFIDTQNEAMHILTFYFLICVVLHWRDVPLGD